MDYTTPPYLDFLTSPGLFSRKARTRTNLADHMVTHSLQLVKVACFLRFCERCGAERVESGDGEDWDESVGTVVASDGD